MLFNWIKNKFLRNKDVVIRKNEVEINPISVKVKYDQKGNCEISINQKGSTVIKMSEDLHIMTGGDLLFTSNGEIGILGKEKVNLDGKEVHLNSRNCKQIRELKNEIINEIHKKLLDSDRKRIEHKINIKNE